jgi:hypothetical protein
MPGILPLSLQQALIKIDDNYLVIRRLDVFWHDSKALIVDHEFEPFDNISDHCGRIEL